MTDDIVRGIEQLLFAITAYLGEIFVAVFDISFKIGAA
jgi:hypothetical protein